MTEVKIKIEAPFWTAVYAAFGTCWGLTSFYGLTLIVEALRG